MFAAISCEILIELGTCVKCPIPTPTVEEYEDNWDLRVATSLMESGSFSSRVARWSQGA